MYGKVFCFSFFGSMVFVCWKWWFDIRENFPTARQSPSARGVKHFIYHWHSTEPKTHTGGDEGVNGLHDAFGKGKWNLSAFAISHSDNEGLNVPGTMVVVALWFQAKGWCGSGSECDGVVVNCFVVPVPLTLTHPLWWRAVMCADGRTSQFVAGCMWCQMWVSFKLFWHHTNHSHLEKWKRVSKNCYGHTKRKAPLLVWSVKLSLLGPG